MREREKNIIHEKQYQRPENKIEGAKERCKTDPESRRQYRKRKYYENHE